MYLVIWRNLWFGTCTHIMEAKTCIRFELIVDHICFPVLVLFYVIYKSRIEFVYIGKSHIPVKNIINHPLINAVFRTGSSTTGSVASFRWICIKIFQPTETILKISLIAKAKWQFYFGKCSCHQCLFSHKFFSIIIPHERINKRSIIMWEPFELSFFIIHISIRAVIISLCEVCRIIVSSSISKLAVHTNCQPFGNFSFQIYACTEVLIFVTN